MSAGEPSLDAHPDAGMLAAFVDGALAGDAQRELERHLATCDDCRAEVRDLHRLVGGPSAARPAVWLPLLAAAVLGAVLLVPSGRAPGPADVHRDTPPASDSPSLVAPLETAGTPVLFVWRPVAGADLYRLTLLDADGTTLHQATSSDTVLSLPSSVMLAPDTRYYWKVEARMDFDRWLASPLAEFTVRESGP